MPYTESLRSASIIASSTLISSDADMPLEAVTVIVALPIPTAVTTPFSTLSTFSLLDCHTTVLSVASAGRTVAIKVSVSPTLSIVLPPEISTEEGRTSEIAETVISFSIPAYASLITFPASKSATFAAGMEILYTPLPTSLMNSEPVPVKVAPIAGCKP